MAETALDPTIIEVMNRLDAGDRVPEAEAMLDAHALYLGETVIDGQTGGTWRAYAGQEPISTASSKPGRGGWRIYMYDGNPKTGVQGVRTLSTSMERKFRMRDLPYRGAKALTMLDVSGWGLEQRISAAHQAMQLTHEYPDGPLDHHLIDGWASDLHTNSALIMDALTDQVAAQNPGYEYAWALATGKSVDHGGNAFRPEATGYGLFVSLRERMRQRGEGSATVAIQGAGAVGIWMAHHAYFSRRKGDPVITVAGMSDTDGMVLTADTSGLIVPFETAQQLGDATYRGPKAARLAQEAGRMGLQAVHRSEDRAANGRNILTLPVDYIAPCALPGTINAQTVPHLGARRGSIGGANNDTDQAAYEWNRANRPGFEEITGEVANSEGTHISIIEREANIKTVELGTDAMPDRAQTMALSETGMVALMERRERMAKELNTTDGRIMAAGLVVASMFPDLIDVNDRPLTPTTV